MQQVVYLFVLLRYQMQKLQGVQSILLDGVLVLMQEWFGQKVGMVLGETWGSFWMCRNDLEKCGSREGFRKLGVSEFKV